MASVGSINFGGLVSGLDTNKIIEDLMKVESRPLERLEGQKTDLNEKLDTFTSMKSSLTDLKTKVSELKSSTSFGVFSASSSDEEALTLNASTSANEGTYKVKILSLAQAETLSSNSYDDSTDKLNISGEIIVNGKSLTIKSSNSLADIRNGINGLDANVSASILKVSDGDNRLIISSDTQGEEGFFIANAGSADALGELGFTDGTKNVRKISDGKILSTEVESSIATIGSMFDLSSDVSGTVSIRGETFEINLSKDTLSSIRDKINDLGITGVSAAIKSVTEDDTTSYRLEITGTEDFTDDNNIFETLGILEGGTSGVRAVFETNTLFTGDTNKANELTTLINLGAQVTDSSSETLTISGTDTNGSSVSRTLEISTTTILSDVLSEIEDAFSNTVTATVTDGKISVQSKETGKTPLQFGIKANNENGGSLDFGTVRTTIEGRERLVVGGEDASILVNNIEVTRESNNVNDVLTGLNLNLKKADPDTEIILTVARNTDEVKTKIEDFVKTYNDFIDFIDENSQYDDETNEAGPLLGDQTTRSVLSRIRDALRTTVFDGDFKYNQLVQVGIETTIEGKLKIDTSKLDDAMNEDMESVISLFAASRQASDNDISFIYHSDNSKSGSYDVTITRAAEQAEVFSELGAGGPDESGTLSITDSLGNTLNVDYSSSMTLEDIANTVVTEAQKTYGLVLKSDTQLFESTNSQENDPITQNTKINKIAGTNVVDGDTITINGTDRSGSEYQRIITVDDVDEPTIQDVLDSIEEISDNEVNATIDPEGRLQIEDTLKGSSKFSFSIETTISGLDFGEFIVEQEGRNSISVEASITGDNRLKINHTAYGSDNTLTIAGGEGLGITDGEYAGVDVAGTINGSVGVGKGQALTASTDDDNSRGIVIRTEITPEDLEREGPDQGTITLVSGIADILYSELNQLTDSVDGFLQAKLDGLDISLVSIDNRINSAEERLSQRRELLVRKFTALERSMASLEAMQQRLTSSLSALPSAGLL